jgi:peptide-methionine (S)-S-oxide reductase
MKATFGAGCFWGVQAEFDKVEGVINTSVGFMGGDKEDPSYEEVCTDETGHAEVVHIEYDPEIVSYDELLEVFWDNHDPTQLNKQGPDVGTQYRSVIFYHSEEQKTKAMLSKQKISRNYDKEVVTQIVPAQTFYPAEEYHQKYLAKRGLNVCH